jgi:hypothetical protein
MMIGGYDTIFKTNSPQHLAKQIMEFVNWPEFVAEIVEEEDFFFYKNAEIKNQWDKNGAIPILENTMIYFLFDEGQLTIVTDEDLTNQIKCRFSLMVER